MLKDRAISEGNRLMCQRFLFQQGNAPIHNTKKVVKLIAEQNVTILKWFPQSPDLSPTENA